MEKDDNNTPIETKATETAVFLNSDKSDLKSSILGQIEKEEVKPTAKWVFSSAEYAVWAMWILTVVLGALSVAVTLYVLSHQRFALYELTHRDFATFVVDVLPVLWLSIFVVMVVFAVFNIRHTKRGYRYPLWMIVGSSLVASLALGAFLHLAGAGFSLDKKMGAWSRGYASQEKLELKWWQNPEEGRLVGTAMYVREGESTAIRFIDVGGKAWQFEADELHDGEKDLLNRGVQVRVFGITTSGTDVFHACGAMPWVQDRSYRGEELNEIRQGAREKISRFKEEKLEQLASSTLCSTFLMKLPKPPQVVW